MNFIELGAGNGTISRVLLDFGFSGVGTDLSPEACENNSNRNQDYIAAGKYEVLNKDFFSLPESRCDLIISSHVIEHLPEEALNQYFAKCRSLLKPGGKVVSLVPANQQYWCIEDETVGHSRRFEREDFFKISKDHDYALGELVGLTYPLSNLLFPLGNELVKRKDSWKLSMSLEEQTLVSSTGVRQIRYKTVFPWFFRYLINDITMFPFFLLQLMFRSHPNSLILYCELQQKAQVDGPTGN